MKYERYPTRGVHQNFVVPNRIHSYKLGPDAYVIYLYLCRSNPARCGKLAEDLNLSPNKVERSISELQSHRLVTVKDGRIFLREQPCKPQGKLKNCYLMPKEIFHLGLPVGAIAVYGFLMHCEDRETYQCYPSYQTIGDAISMSRSTVKKYVECLINRQLIYTEPTRVWGHSGKKRNGTLRYTIRPIYEAIQHHANTQLEQMSMFTNQPA